MNDVLTTKAFTKGAKVVIDPVYTRPGDDTDAVYVVEKVPAGRRGVNYTLEPVAGGLALKAPGYVLAEASERQVERAEAMAPKGPVPELGSVVNVTGYTDPYVVIGIGSNAEYKIALLGGDGNHYINKVRAGRMSVIARESITIT